MNQIPDATVAIRRVTWLGLIFNLFLAGFKFLAGVFGHSQVLIADAVHSSSDLLTDVTVLVGSCYWSRPADQDHPCGHAKQETLITFFIGVALALVGVGLIQHGIHQIKEIIVEDIHPETPGIVALVAALVSIVLKEFLYRVTVRVGQRTRSSATIANAWHHRSDAISSIPAVLAIGGTLWLGPVFVFLDPLGTVVVSFMILFTAFEIIRSAVFVLVDTSGGEKLAEEIRTSVLAEPEVKEVHKIRTRPLGNNLYAVDLHIHVRGDMSVLDAHSLSHKIQRDICAGDSRLLDVIIHVEPFGKSTAGASD